LFGFPSVTHRKTRTQFKHIFLFIPTSFLCSSFTPSRHIPYFFIAGVCKIYCKSFQATLVFMLRDTDIQTLPNSTDDVRRFSSRGRGIIIIVIINIIIIIIISFMLGIYTYIPETNYVPREYSVADNLLLLFMVLISLVSVLNLLYFYICTFRSMCAVPNMAVFCSSLTSCFPGMLLTYFLNYFEIVPVAPIITGITFVSTFHMHCVYIYYYY